MKRQYFPQQYHIIQEIQKYNIPDYRPHREWFQKAAEKIKSLKTPKRLSTNGYAFSQTEDGQSDLIRSYDTRKAKPLGF
jgi:phospholipid-transporting ATPase